MESVRSEYDVFLSFRGPDARLSIVDHLYECMTGAGLHVFKDDKEIRRGEVIEGELKRAICVSRVYVVVFSRNYASSAWCLRELDMMMDLHGGSNVGKKIILPIFYKVDPKDVKLRTKLYRKALDKHKGRHGEEVVKKWEKALKTVGGISGWDCKAIQGEGRFVRLIVQDIVVMLRIKDRSLPNHLTGIDDRVSDMLNLLNCDSSGVRLVVLHGMGGIGKTTLASTVFNKILSQFEGSSFISNVRESATGHGGIAKLLNKLSGDILGGHYVRSCNFDDGFGEIIQRIQGKRMLLVLDDVDQFPQLEKLVGKDPKDTLGTGSRVIITTRDKSVCNPFVRLGSEVLQFYEMEKMANNYALQLFSRHAFGTDEPPIDYLYLSKQLVETTGNLPLALEVIGGHLCCPSKELWEDMLKKLKNIPQKEVFNILKVSYDGLDCNEKEIFLDIACFQQHEMPRKYADYLWEARNLYPKCGVKVLINKSLIKIDSNGKFWIHDQLRDMGRAINRSKGDGRSERRTRLWDPKDALKIVLQKQVSKEIIAMTLGNYGEALKLSDENFGGIANLLFLDLKSTELIGEFENLRENLMWLSWRGRAETLNSNFFKMRNLVVLKIDCINGEWTGGEKLMMPELKVLEFWKSDITTSPDLSCCLKLEIMVFNKCYFLRKIHHSVGKLESLAYMKISECQYLRSLPKELCSATTSLKSLLLDGCDMLQELPRLPTSLIHLTFSTKSLRAFPNLDVLTNLAELRVFDGQYHKKDYEGERLEISGLGSLDKLKSLSFCPSRMITFTRTSVLGSLSKLQTLDLLSSYMESVLELPLSLRQLALWDTRTPIPWEHYSNLTLLTELEIKNSILTDMDLGGLDSLPSLWTLCFYSCYNLVRVSNIGRLRKGLRSLKFISCRVLMEIPGLEQLEMLEELTIWDCPSICGIQDLLGLKRLKIVNIEACSSLLYRQDIRIPLMS